MRVQSLGQEDPLEKGLVTHASILAWEIPWTEEPGGLQSRGPRGALAVIFRLLLQQGLLQPFSHVLVPLDRC